MACVYGVELHCSDYLREVLNVIIEVIGSHVHIHNPNIGSRFIERYRKFEKQIKLPKNSGTTEFPTSTDFFTKPEVHRFRSTLNCQPVRNFVIEMIAIVTLSHQKQMTLPIINPKDVNNHYLYKAARSLKIGGTNLEKVIAKNELKIILQVIEKYLLTSKVEEAIYWVLWIIKIEGKIKRKGEKLPCKSLNIDGVPKKQSDHWVWYVWKSLFARVAQCSYFKKKQIIDLYEMFKIDFTKTIVVQRLPLLFFSMRLLKYESINNFPSILNNLRLHVQAYSNVNVLYKNLQIKVRNKCWLHVVNKEEVKPKKMTKTMKKEYEKKKQLMTLQEKTAYLDIIPKADNPF
jgi:hypothetical protein